MGFGAVSIRLLVDLAGMCCAVLLLGDLGVIRIATSGGGESRGVSGSSSAGLGK